MTMVINGEHRPSGKEGVMRIDTCWSEEKQSKRSNTYVVLSAGAYTVPSFGENSLEFHTETRPVAGSDLATSEKFSMKVLSGAVGSVANFNNDLNMTYDAIWEDDGRFALLADDAHPRAP